MDNRPIGVMDSGAGGLTVARVLAARYPKESILYFGDSARNPYGERTKKEIIEFAGQIKHFLLEKDVKAVVLACNTITFNVPASFYEEKVPVIGMSLDFSALPQVETAAVFATPASIATHAHKGGLLKVMPDAKIVEVPCDGLANAIERLAPHDEIRELLQNLIEKYGAWDAKAAVFGCTHYPLIIDIFKELLPDTRFLDPAEVTAEKAMAVLKERDALAESHGKDVFYFSGETEPAARIIEAAMGEKKEVCQCSF